MARTSVHGTLHLHFKVNSSSNVITLHDFFWTGGQIAHAFTNSFVYAKVVEVQRQMEECFQCFCNSEGPYCEPIPGGNNISFCVRMPGMDFIIYTSVTSILDTFLPL